MVQEPLPEEAREKLVNESRPTSQLRKTIDVIDVVLGFLSSGVPDPNQPLHDYIANTLSWRDPSIKVFIITTICKI